ncbi:hypothetical protein BC830DRAFT_480423 [Chytriomyces sp. MP71]|nr:hypothetical protein BC830DRAFT_480423 [Chytriomyces sp. MP71]
MLEGVRLSPTTAPTTRVVGGIHPSSATEAAAFVVDGMATCVTGRVELVLDGVGGGLQLDQVCITVSIHGEIKTVSRAHPDTATHKVIGPASRTVIFNSATQGPLSLRKPPFTLPFQVPLNALDLPPAFPIITDPVNSAFAFTDVNQLSPAGKGPDASASIKYSIKASVSYMQDGEEIIKDIEVPLVILPPEAKRAFLLATQSSFSLSNVDTNDEHSIPHEGINYLWTIAKRAVVQGDTFCMEINSSSPYTLEHTVKISLRARLTIRSPNGNVQTSSKNLATVCEPLIPAALHSKLSKLHLENVEAPRECTTRLMLHVPPDIVASMDTTAFTYTHFLRLELMHEGEVVALVDVPAAVVQRGTGQAGQLGLPRLARIESRAWQDVPKNELEDSMSSLYVARWGYVPDADGWEDEISLEVGDELLVSYVFSDGMVYVENLTQRCKGLVPMHHLIEAAFLEQKLTEQIQKTNATDPIAIPVHVVSSPTPSITRGTNLDNRPAEPDDNTMNGTISQSSPSLVLGPQSPTIIGSSPLMTGSSGSGLSPSQSGNSRVSPIPPLTPAALSFNSSIPEISVATTEVLSSELPPSYDEIADTVEPIASTPTAPSHLISAHQSTLTTGSSTLASRIDRNASSSTRFFARFRQTNNTVVNVPAVVPRVIDGVVSVESAEAHLGLLHRFAALENKIDRMSDWRFLCRAEQRYLIWLDYLREEQPDPSSLPLPPLE